MNLEIWLAFLLASAVVLVIPGPTIMLVVSYGLAEGRRAALAVVIGVALGDMVAVTLAFAGLGALLAASAELFTLVKWIGAAYLIWLGVKLWRASPSGGMEKENGLRRRRSRMLAHAFLVTALNPKGYAFFIAFLPQFIDPGLAILPQIILLGATFVALAIVNAAAYALLAGSARGLFRPSAMRALNRLGGGILVGAGVAMASLRRAA